MKKLHKLLTALTTCVMMISCCPLALATNDNDVIDIQEAQISQVLELSEAGSDEISSAEYKEAEEMGLEIISKISDEEVLQALVDNGNIEYSENGELPEFVMVYKTTEDENVPSGAGNSIMPAATSVISISKTDYYDGQYFDIYDRYVIDGPCEFTQTYSRKSTANWNCSMTGNVSVGGSVFSVADVKAAVSNSMGYTIGNEYTKSSTYKASIPSGKYWEIKVWTSYRVFTYTAKVGSVTLTSGKSWYPNGLVIMHTQYSK